MCITGYGIMDNSIHSTWKSESAAFPRPANRVTHNSIRQPVTHIPTPPTTTETHPFLPVIHKRQKELRSWSEIKNVNTGYLIRAPTGGRTAQTLQLNTAAPQNQRSVGTPPLSEGGFFMRRQPCWLPFVRMTDSRTRGRQDFIMAFFASAVGVLKTLVIALGAGLGIWGVVNLMEGYGNDNPGANAQVS